MPATSPYLINLGPGTTVSLADIGLKGDEAFLLVHSVEDASDFGAEVKRFDQSGELIYYGLQDPYFRLSYDADCLSFQGLANLEPGKVIAPANLNNYLPGALGHGASKLIFRRPRRRRMAGNLASLQFEVDAISLSLAGGGSTSGGFGTDFPTDDGSTTVGNGTVGGTGGTITDYSFNGQSVFARRETVLSLTLGSDTIANLREDIGLGTDGLVSRYYYGLPTFPADQPADLADFSTNFDPITDNTYSTLTEVYDLPSSTHLLSDGGGNLIPDLIAANIDPRTSLNTNPVVARFIAIWENQPYSGVGPDQDSYSFILGYNSQETTLQEFLDTYNGGEMVLADPGFGLASRRLLRLFCNATGTYFYP